MFLNNFKDTAKMVFKLKERLIIFFVFTLFFLIIFLQHSFVYFYHDDFGYASLSYGYVPEGVKPGLEYNFYHIIDFLVWQYKNWGGRVLFFFFEILVLRGGLWTFRILQSLIITLLFYLIYKITLLATNGEITLNQKILTSITTCLFYGFLPSYILRESICWATASFVYLWPLLFLFSAVYFYIKLEKTGFNRFWFLIVCFSVFIASFSHEVVSIITFLFFTLVFLHKKLYQKGKSKIEFIIFICSLSGSMFLFLAPGNIKRFAFHHQNGVTLLNGIISTVKGMFFNYFNEEILVWYILISFSLLILFSVKDKIFFKKSYGKVLSLLLALITTYFLEIVIVKNRFLPNSINFFIFLIFFTIFSISAFIFFIKKKLYYVIFLVTSGALSQLFLFTMCGFPSRASLPFMIVLIFLSVRLIFELIISEKCCIWREITLTIIFSSVILTSSIKFTKILYGYYQNSFSNKKNFEILKKLKIRQDILMVNLFKLKDDFYSECMPYQEDRKYIEYWMKFYYGLPQQTKFNWVEYDKSSLNLENDMFIIRKKYLQ